MVSGEVETKVRNLYYEVPAFKETNTVVPGYRGRDGHEGYRGRGRGRGNVFVSLESKDY